MHKSREEEMNVDINIKVTRIKSHYHSRLIADGVVVREMACADKCDIGWISRELLRWYDKLCGVSRFASAARDRQTSQPVGKIWNCDHLKAEDDGPC